MSAPWLRLGGGINMQLENFNLSKPPQPGSLQGQGAESYGSGAE